MTVWYAALFTLIGSVLIVLVAWVVATRHPAAPAEQVGPLVYRVRRVYFFVIVTIAVALLALTLPRTPYARSARESPAMTLTVDGVMWSWRVTGPDTSSGSAGPVIVPVGKPVRFEVGALDVNHGFAVYRPDGGMLGQTQAMPGYRNALTLTFPAPGTYRILCLEYCGLGHHSMISSIEAR